jgi:hypothetical protein
MRLKEHPRIQWPPHWSEPEVNTPTGEQGILKIIDLIGPVQILLGKEIQDKVQFAELNCSNPAFTARLYEKLKALAGRPLEEVGAIELDL